MRSVESGKEILKVLANASKGQNGESSEDSMCGQRWTLACSIWEETREFEVDGKGSELCQGGQDSDHYLG
jgi:hypothetical protein